MRAFGIVLMAMVFVAVTWCGALANDKKPNKKKKKEVISRNKTWTTKKLWLGVLRGKHVLLVPRSSAPTKLGDQEEPLWRRESDLP